MLLPRLALAAALMLPTASAQQAPLDDGAGAYRSGTYRNVFAELGHPQAEIDHRLDTAFDQLFHGDPATQSLFYETGSNRHGPLAYITDVANHDVRTEGMSYGMMIAVQRNRQREFDALWNWANTYMLITDRANPSHGYFSWSMNLDGTPRSDSPAPDGEEYFVMSLYFAANRWGSRSGIYNYKQQADRLLTLMRHHATESGAPPFRLKPHQPVFAPPPQTGLRSTGPMVDEHTNMILFVPNSGGNTFSDPSYHLPAFYELWARWGPRADRAFWAQAAVVSRQYFARVTDPATGLAPDRAHLDGSPMHDPDGQPVAFAYDAWRTASNWAVDSAWWHKDPNESVLSERIERFLFAQGIDTFSDRYTLEGKPLSTRHSTGMLATTAVSTLALPAHPAPPNPIPRAFVEALWNTPTPSGPQRYYDGMLYLMSLMHLAGDFRIWPPH